MSARISFRRFHSTNGLGFALFRPDQKPWRTYLVLALRPRQRRVLLRLPRHLIGLSWWPPRFWNTGALLAERDNSATAT